MLRRTGRPGELHLLDGPIGMRCPSRLLPWSPSVLESSLWFRSRFDVFSFTVRDRSWFQRSYWNPCVEQWTDSFTWTQSFLIRSGYLTAVTWRWKDWRRRKRRDEWIQTKIQTRSRTSALTQSGSERSVVHWVLGCDDLFWSLCFGLLLTFRGHTAQWTGDYRGKISSPVR